METKIEGYTDLIKDNHTGAILNTNNSAYIAALKRSKALSEQKQQIQQTTDEINNIKEDVRELKNMMRTLIGQLENGR